jgi:helicase/secretion neighborhood TadE-like protein
MGGASGGERDSEFGGRFGGASGGRPDGQPDGGSGCRPEGKPDGALGGEPGGAPGNVSASLSDSTQNGAPPARRRFVARLREESGSGSLLAVGVVASVFALTMMLVPLAQALVIKQRVVGAADAAALAAADTASGAIAGFPCEAADAVARLNGAVLGGCELDGAVVTVSAGARYLGFDIVVFARAGPPGSAP